MKIAITGAAGFIASHIADAYIKAGHEVHIIDNLSTGNPENINPKAVFHRLDINDAAIGDLFAEEKFDILNHHAAQMDVRFSVTNPIFDAQTNILGGLNLYEAALKNKVRKVIFASTGGAIYGEQDYFPADENHPTRPCSPYGIAKLTNEKYLYYYKEVHGLKYTVLRYANVYGPRQNVKGEAGVVAIFCDRLIKNIQPVINGDGLNSRDYVYVADVVAANVLALRNDMNGIYNVGTGVENDVNKVFRTLRDILNPEMNEYHGEAKQGEQRRSSIDNTKIRQEYGWVPKVDFESGLKLTSDYFAEHIV